MKRTFVLLLLSLTCSCSSARRTTEPIPSRDLAGEARAASLVENGDRFRQKNHLYGWRQAELFYERSCRLLEVPELRNRLALTRFLIISRELDQGFFYDHHQERLSKLCSGASSSLQINLCQAAREKLRLAGLIPGTPPTYPLEFEAKAREWMEPDLADYLSLVVSEESAPDLYLDRLEVFLARYPRSPLSVYLKLRLPGYSVNIDHVSWSDGSFAELFLAEGFSSLGREEFQQGFGLVTRGLALIPDHATALTDVADVYLYTLGMAELAESNYCQALVADGKSVRARFGFGVAAHLLGRYVDSNIALDQVLERTGSGGKAFDPVERSYYQGLASYFKAYNLYLLGQLDEVRPWVDRALQVQPRLKGARYLSGILYSDRDMDQEAEDEFEKVIEGGTELCDAYYRLGRLQGERNEESMLRHFMNNAICLDRKVRLAQKEFEAVDDLDIDPGHREMLRTAREEQLDERRSEALASLVSMLNRTKPSESARATVLRGSMRRVFDRLSTF